MSLSEIPIKQVMTTAVVTINVNHPFSEVAKIFTENKIRHLPVVDDEGTLVGLMSKRDLYHTVAPRRDFGGEGNPFYKGKISDASGDFYLKENLDQYLLDKVMVKDVRALHGDNSLKDALRVLVTAHIGCVVVVDDDNKVEGIITRYDILRFIDEKGL